MRRENNFDILRLILAWIVVVTHTRDLSRAPALGFFWPLLQSRRAVEGFFAISGCLIVASWDRSRSLSDYAARRARRILPAYWAAIVGCVLLGSVMTTLSFAAFWRQPQVYHYLFWNLLFLNFRSPSLPGVFQANPNTSAMDGALWTIKIEIAFYILVPLFVWLMRRLGATPLLVASFLGSVAFHLAMVHMGRNSLSLQLPGQFAFFAVGAAVWYYHDAFVRHRKAAWAACAVLVPLAFWSNSMPLDALAIPLLILSIGLLLPAYRGITAHGDFSYGTYVLHCPVIQTVVALGLFARAPWLASGVVFAVVAALSVVSWFVIEAPFLRPARVRQQERNLPETAKAV